jgi:hypothetical protein
MSEMFAFKGDYHEGLASPWKRAFPDSSKLGCTDAFMRRCEKFATNGEGLVSKEVARSVWMEILQDYETSVKMGLWIPDGLLEEHRRVARALGWLTD